jgi:hypothetical protein
MSAFKVINVYQYWLVKTTNEPEEWKTPKHVPHVETKPIASTKYKNRYIVLYDAVAPCTWMEAKKDIFENGSMMNAELKPVSCPFDETENRNYALNVIKYFQDAERRREQARVCRKLEYEDTVPLDVEPLSPLPLKPSDFEEGQPATQAPKKQPPAEEK